MLFLSFNEDRCYLLAPQLIYIMDNQNQNGHGLSFNDTTSSTATCIPERSDCMYANAAPQYPACSGMSTSSNTHTIPGTGDYPGFCRSAFQNGSQQVFETTRLGDYQQQRYLATGQLSGHTNVHSPFETRNLGSFNGYTAAENSLPINQVSASENCARYEALSKAMAPQSMASTASRMPMDQMSMDQMSMVQHMLFVSGNFIAHPMPYTNRTVLQHPEVSTLTSWNQTVSPVVPQQEESAYQNQVAHPMLYNSGFQHFNR